uniref:Uncharacterized protein n=1 Tax=uncultured marine virus TaxID=186617 RepID=A0A0F7LAU9_9VIRU|nr:hypothetical protein [uncultured marine virus]
MANTQIFFGLHFLQSNYLQVKKLPKNNYNRKLEWRIDNYSCCLYRQLVALFHENRL